MKLLGKEISDYDASGNLMHRAIIEWFKDGIYDLSDNAYTDEDATVLDRLQEIAERAGCTNIQQVEYVHSLENRISQLEEKVEAMDRVLTSVCSTVV